jgi:RNA polymerase sigma factor (sigma-70 family)
MKEYTRQEEKALFEQAQAGDRASVAALMQQHERLVHAVVRRQWSGRLRYVDVVHEGRIGLWRAILHFDPDRGTAFSTYAWPAIARQVWKAVEEAQAELSHPIAHEEVGDDVAQQVIQTEVSRTLRATVAQLPHKERWVVARYYGLDGRGGRTQRTLGEKLGCTQQAISYHVRKAVRRLRHPGWSARLRALLGYQRRADYRAAVRPSSGGCR